MGVIVLSTARRQYTLGRYPFGDFSFSKDKFLDFTPTYLKFGRLTVDINWVSFFPLLAAN